MVRFITRCCRFVIALLVAIVSSVQAMPAVVGIAASSLVTAATFAAGKTIYVDDSAGSGGDGEDWTTAYRVLQDAIADAEDHTQNIDNTAEILVAGGTYYPDRVDDSTTGTGDRTDTFSLLERVTMKGGYSGSGTTRDPEIHISYLDGDLLGNDGGSLCGSTCLMTMHTTSSAPRMKTSRLIIASSTASRCVTEVPTEAAPTRWAVASSFKRPARRFTTAP